MEDVAKYERRKELDLKRKLLTKEVLEQRIKKDEGHSFSSGEFLIDE